MHVNKLLKLLFILWVLSFGSTAFAQKVGGFYPNWYASTTINNIQWDKLTDVFYAFGQPTTTGGITISNESRLATLVTNGHPKGVKIHLSFGGAAQGSTGWAETVSNTTNIQAFAKNVAAKVQQYDLDGINLDWEFPSASYATGYTNLALEIRKELDALQPIMGRRIELSAAVAPLIWNNDGISSTFIKTMDYLYVMAFDDGSCTYCGGPNHSSLTMAKNAFLHWTTGIPGAPNSGRGALPSQIIIAIPFYDNGGAFYKDFSATDPAGFYNDADGYFGGKYYNSRPLIEQKGDYVMTNGGAGIWTWEIVQDRTDQYSLLGAMKNKIDQYSCATPSPNLGADQSICGVSSITLNSQVATASGRTFTWKRNGTILVNASATATTYAVNQAGTYTVDITENGCTKTDDVVISGTLATPNLGGPYELCSPAQQLLDSKITGSNLSYIWKKDNVVISGANQSTYTATSKGTFSVTVSASGCTSTSGSAIVNSSLPTVQHDTICASGQVSLTASAPVEWYNAQTNGSLVFNGSTYSPTISSTTTYWVQQSGTVSNSYTTGRTAFQGDGWQQDANVYGIKFQALQELTLDQVTVNAGGGGQLKINVVASNGTTVVASKTVTVTGGLTPVNLGFKLAAGTYYLNTVGSAVTVYTDITAASNFTVANVITVEGNAYWDWSAPYGDAYVQSGHYGTFINWKVTTGGVCDRIPAYAVIDVNNSSCSNTPPTANFSANTVNTCVGNNITFTDASTGGTTTSWSWNFGTGATPATATGKGPHVVSYSSIGQKTVSLTSTNAFGTNTATKTNYITITNVPTAAGSITGSATVCQGSVQNYSISAVANATSYTWTVPTGAIITQNNGTSITVDYSSAISGTLSVSPKNGCGSANPTTLAITVNPLPNAANVINGNGTVCFNATNETYSVNTVLNATSYVWTVPTGTTIVSGQNTNTITVNFTNASNGNISITPKNACGNGPTQTKAISINQAPSDITTIAGKANICPNEKGIVYSISPSTGATSYVWTIPTNASIVTGQGTTDLTVNFGATGGALSVKAINMCGESKLTTKTIAVTGTTIPLVEGFESGINWTVENKDANVTWNIYNLGANGTSTQSAFINFRNYSGSAQEDALVTPTLNFAGKSNINLTFKHAYAWWDKGGTRNDAFDGLKVMISTDCGATFTELWNKNGTTLSTLAGGAGTGSEFFPTSTQWIQNTINLSAYDGNSSVIIKFVGVNGNGNNLFIDDISIDGNTLTAPTANFTSDKAENCVNQIFTFTDASLGSPSSWSWNFGTGATPATATGQGPHAVSYSSGGQKTISLSVSNSLGSNTKTQTVLVNTLPANVSAITGSNAVCNNAVETYSITASAGATNYTWTVPTGASIVNGQGTTAITVNFGNATNGSISVTPSNTCGNAQKTTLAVTVSPSASNAGTITGSKTVCANDKNINYSIATVNSATAYNWTVPTGATIVSGQNTNAIVVNFGTSAGNITVTPMSSCGNGQSASLAVSITNGAGNAGNITGNNTVCKAKNETYSIATVNGATSYNWTIPTGASIVSGQNTNTITVDFTNASNGNITVTPMSSCGNGQSASLAIQVNTIPANAGNITGNNTVCKAKNESYSITAVNGATSYNWTIPTGATIVSGQNTNTITVDFTNASNGNITVTPSNTCGNGQSNSLAIQVNTIPANAGTITGNGSVCANEQNVSYSIATVTGATAYNWTVPTGATIVQNFGASITVNFGSTAGNVTVTPSNTCGNGQSNSKAISITNGAANAGTITGNNTVCANQKGVSYSITAVNGASSYNWTLPTGATIVAGANTNNITVDFGTSAGNITVTPMSSCGNGQSNSLAIQVNAIPANAGTITGNNTVCKAKNETYSIASVTGATSYNWTIPTGATIVSGQNTNTITVDFTNASNGNITVTPTNTCGNGLSSSKTIQVNTIPANAGTITGKNIICPNEQNVSYSITAVNGATSYNWTLPNGASIVSGQNTNAIVVNFGATAGTIFVTPSNTCGNGQSNSLAITTNQALGTTGTITGKTTICVNESDVVYSIPAVSGATAYDWTIPTGATITSNIGTSITVNFGTNGGNVSVTPKNSCQIGTKASIVINVNPIPSTAGKIIGNSTPCQNAIETYSISSVSGATAYNWTVPTGAIITQNNGTSITVDFAKASNGDITVTPSNTCGTGGQSVQSITINQVPSTTTASLSGLKNVCANQKNVTYSFSNVTNATAYNWVVPTGATIVSGQNTNSIVVNFGATAGNISVTPSNTCGNGSTSSLLVSITNGAGNAGTITGNAIVCANEKNVNYSIAAVNGASSYNWTVPTGATIISGQNTNSITVDFGTSAGDVSVTPISSCGNGQSNLLAIQVNTVPAKASAINGVATVCENTTQTYSITPIANATTYNWTVPADASITQNNQTSITVKFGVSAGNISVTPSNACGNGSTTSLGIILNSIPSSAGAINGLTTVCQNQKTVTYDVASVNNATTYNWTIPTGATIVSGQNTNAITVDFGTSGGNITVTPANACGKGITSTKSISATQGAGNAGTITGNTTVCANEKNVTYSINPVNGASAYNWTVPTGAIITQNNGTSIMVDFGTTAGNVSVTPTSSCGNGQSASLTIQLNTVPSSAGTITGNKTVCQNQNESYSIASVNGATTYNWTVPTGATIISGQNTNSITVDFTKASNGNITVTPSNACGNGQNSSLAIQVNANPTAAGIINGKNAVCSSEKNVVYSIATITNATAYNWTIPTGATIISGQNTNSITVDFGTNGGNISVTPSNTCGNGQSNSLAIAITTGAGNAGTITGNTTVCANEKNVSYSIAAVNGASAYNWTVPTGSTIISGQNTTAIVVNFGTSAGNVSVTPTSACGNGQNATLSIKMNSLPANAGTITGNKTVCTNSVENYSIASVTGATTYNWTVPTGATIVSGQNTTTITVDFTNATNGNISVTPSNACGNSTGTTIGITVNTAPANAGTITGNATVCTNEKNVSYSIASVTGATTYNWTIPTGSTIISGQNTNAIVVNFGTSAGDVSVTPSNTCGTGLKAILSVNLTNGAGNAGKIIGTSSICANTKGINYSIPAVTGASAYNWTIPIGATIVSGQNTNAITVDFGTNSGNITVTPTSACGNGQSASLAVSVETISAPSTITGNKTVCANAIETYGITAINNAISYTWTIPTGTTIVKNNGNTIDVDFTNASNGNITVTPIFACGNGQTNTLAISINSINALSTISGDNTPCENSTQTYSITAVNGATNYIWEVTSQDMNIVSGQGTNSISVAVNGITSGEIKVTATSTCGNSQPSTLNVTPIICGMHTDFMANVTQHCQTGTVTFTDLSTGVKGKTSYNWNFGNGQTANTVGPHTINYTKSGIYTVTLTLNQGNTTEIETKNAYIVVGEQITTSAITGNTTISCNSTSEKFAVTNHLNSTYIWATTLGTITSGQGSNAISIDFSNEMGTGQITVTEKNGTCESVQTLNYQTCIITANNDDVNQENIIIYPNPSINEFTINNPFGKITIEVYEVNGVMLEKMETDKEIFQFGKDLISGSYIVKISTTNGDIHHYQLIKY